MKAAAALCLAMLLAACAGRRADVDPAAACKELGGALVQASELKAAANAPLQPALPQHCRVLGQIAPEDPKAPPIHYQVNLPTRWNGRAVQYGGGGFNGVLITGTALAPAGRPDRAAPLALGYVTYGTDSGHQNVPNVALQAFSLNDEALVNFAHASYKKVRDVAVALIERRYGEKPERVYFIGSSEGGREGLTMAQRYPADFDGIFSVAPSKFIGPINPDLAEFRSRGGKLIVLEHMADYAQSPYAGVEYYRSVVKRMGQGAVDDFVRLYVAPGVDHVGTGAPANVDMLAVLAAWVERDQPPEDLEVLQQERMPPFTITRSLPLCRWPQYPHYIGGDTAVAGSFECRKSTE